MKKSALWVYIFVLAFATPAMADDPPIQQVHIRGSLLPNFGQLRFFNDGDGPGRGGRGGGHRDSGGGGGGGAVKEKPVKEKPAAVADSKTESKTCNPVLVMTGEKYKDELDFQSSGMYGLSLIRTYRSKNTGGTLFGPNWLSSLDFPKLTLESSFKNWAGRQMYRSVTLTQPDGTKYRYTVGYIDDGNGASANYSVRSAASMGEMVYEASSGYTVNIGNKTYLYDAGGYITSIADGITGEVRYFEHAPSWGGTVRIRNNGGQLVELTVNSSGRATHVKDPDGNIWTYEYNGTGMLTKVSSPGSPASTRTYHYEETTAANAHTLLTGISINNTRHSRYSYYADGRVKQSSLEGGEQVDEFSYGSDHTVVKDARGQTTTYTYAVITGEKKITSVSRTATSTCAASAAKTVYDSNGYIDYELDWKGNKSDYTYDASGKLQKVVTATDSPDALGLVYTWQDDRVVQLDYLNAAGYPFRKVVYSYNGARIATETWIDVRTGEQRRKEYSYEFGAGGVLKSVSESVNLGAEKSTTVRAFDGLGNVRSLVNALGHTEVWDGFNGLGMPKRYINSNGVETTYSYNVLGLMMSMTETGGRTTTWTYTPDRQLQSAITPSGLSVHYDYNAAGRLIVTRNGLGESQRFGWGTGDNRSRISTDRKVPLLNAGIPTENLSGEFSTTIMYDSLGRPYTLLGNSNQKTERRYDLNGNLQIVTDASGRKTSYEYDAQNRLVKILAPDGGATSLSYDDRGNLEVVTDPRGLRTIYAYNGFGEVVMMISPDTGKTSYAYDTGGRLQTETPASGSTIIYLWDAAGRLRSKTAGGSINTYIYDEGVYGKGLLTRMQDHTGETVYTYGPSGELLRQTNHIFDQVFNTTWTYDNSGRKETMTYPSGMMLKYTYDAAGRVSTIKSNGIR
jgi:YD repeat-containing protein